MKASVWARNIDHRRTDVTVHSQDNGWVTWHEKEGTGDLTIHANTDEIPQLQEMINDLTRLRDDLINRRNSRLSIGSADGLDVDAPEEQSAGAKTLEHILNNDEGIRDYSKF